MHHFVILIILSCSLGSIVAACETADSGTGVPDPTGQTSGTEDIGSPDTFVSVDSVNDTNTSGTSGFQPDTNTSGTTQPDTNTSNACSYNYDPPTPDLCAGDQICILDSGLGGPGHCEGAFGRLYSVNLGGVRVPERRSDGECWDIGCGAPDLFFEVLLDGRTILTTATIDDRLEVDAISEHGSALISSGSVLQIILYDEDITENEPMGGCQLNPISADALRTRIFACGSATEPSFLFSLSMQ